MFIKPFEMSKEMSKTDTSSGLIKTYLKDKNDLFKHGKENWRAR